MLNRNIIETERLILRRWETGDAEALFRYASDSRVSELALWPRHEDVEMSRMVIEQFFIPNQSNYAIVSKEKNEPIGCIGLVPADDEHYLLDDSEREVGYWIGCPHWNKGITTEALEGFINYCRGVSDIKSLVITTDVRNIASQRVAWKCGFIYIEDYMNNGIESKAYRLIL